MKALFSYSPSIEYSYGEIALENKIFRDGVKMELTPNLIEKFKNNGLNPKDSSLILSYGNYILFHDEQNQVVFEL